MAKCTECVHYGVCKVLIGGQEIRIADIACSFSKQCVAYKHKENFAEVVRCKDCKHYVAPQGTYVCDCFEGLYFATDNDFCSYGERRSGE